MRPSVFSRALRYAGVAVAGASVLTYLIVAGLRLRYPFELEWLEGGGLEHVRRILAGQPLYVPPSLDFIAFPYTPLYYYASALVAWILGQATFVAMRSVSVAASIAMLAAVAAIVWRESGRWHVAVLAAGLMAATYGITDGWFDVGRVDTLFVALLLLGVLGAQVGSDRALIAGGLCLGLACLVKQTAVVATVPIMISCAAADRRRSARLVVPGIALPVVCGLYWQHASGGWFWYYVFDLQRRVGVVVPLRFLKFWTRDMVHWLGLAGAFGLWHLLSSGHRRPGRGAAIVTVAAISLVLAGWLSRVRSGNDVNVLMPAYAALAILFGLGLADIERRCEKIEGRRRAWLEGLVYAMCLAQFTMLRFDPRSLVPTPADRRAGALVVGRIAALPGDVFVPCQPYLATMAGKRSFAHVQEIYDVVESGDGPIAERVRAELMDDFERQRFRAVVPCVLRTDVLDANGFATFYAMTEEFFREPDRTFLLRTGVPVRPEGIYLPRQRPAGSR